MTHQATNHTGKMDVGIVTPRYPPNVSGGGEVSVQLLAEQLVLSDRIANVTVLSFDGQAREQINDIEVKRIRKIPGTVTEIQNLRAYPHLRNRLAKFDVIHAYNMELHPVVGAITECQSVPAVGTLNSYHFFPRAVANATATGVERLYELIGHPTSGRVLQRYVKRLDRLIAISESVRSTYVEQGYDADHISVIPNMLDPEFSVPDSTSRQDTETQLLFVGRLVEIKGVSYLLRAMTRLSDRYHLRIVGDGPMRAELERLSTRLNLDDRVTFAGRLPYDEIPATYARADLFVHPGIWPEPFGRTVLEAMQAGLPVVCTDIGGPAELVRDEELRAPPKDPEGLADAIQEADGQGQQLGEQNKKYVRSTFSPETVVSRLVSCYESIS